MALTAQESSNITYRGWKSVTFQFVMLGFVTGTALLVFHYIDASTWKDSVMGLLTGYVVRDGFTKAAEVYFSKKIMDAAPADVPEKTPAIGIVP